MPMLILLAAALSVAVARPPKAPEPVPTEPSAPVAAVRTITTQAELAGEAGLRATVVGMLTRVTHGEIEGTAIVLSDGVPVFVTQGEPPEGWAWMLGTKVRVQGALWPEGTGGADAWKVPTLVEPDAPMPADVAMPGMGF